MEPERKLRPKQWSSAGPHRAQAVRSGIREPQVTRHPPLRPRPTHKPRTGFDPSPRSCRGPATALANEATGRRDRASPSGQAGRRRPAGFAQVVIAGRALSIGRQRSTTDNHGSCPCPPSCRITPSGAGRGCFPSSRWEQSTQCQHQPRLQRSNRDHAGPSPNGRVGPNSRPT
jgi:hypothetical protein